MDGWMDGWIGVWTGGRLGRWTASYMDQLASYPADGCTAEQLETWTAV